MHEQCPAVLGLALSTSMTVALQIRDPSCKDYDKRTPL